MIILVTRMVLPMINQLYFEFATLALVAFVFGIGVGVLKYDGR